MTDCSITPSFDLVTQWAHESPIEYSDESWAYELFIAHKAAQWGADQELEACCEWIDPNSVMADELRAARRPEPPSLAEQALERLELAKKYVDVEPVRRALERLQELENND